MLRGKKEFLEGTLVRPLQRKIPAISAGTQGLGLNGRTVNYLYDSSGLIPRPDEQDGLVEFEVLRGNV